MTKTFKGTCSKLIFHNPETQFEIREFTTTDKEKVIVSGVFLNVKDELLYEISAELVNHPKYGEQYKLITISASNEMSSDGFVNFLSSKRFKGIGKRTALKIFNTLGSDCLNKIIENPNCLKQFRLSKEVIANLQETLKLNRELDNMHVKLYELGFTSLMIARLQMVYELEAYQKVIANPYRLIDDIEGYGFIKADALAMNMGILPNDPRRVAALIIYSLSEALDSNGGTYLTTIQLKEEIKLKDRAEIDEQLIDEHMIALVANKKLYIEEDRVYLAYMYNIEVALANVVNNFAKNAQLNKYTPDMLDKEIKHFETFKKISFSDRQTEAIKLALQNQISIISGGPGTGKTTLIQAIYTIWANLRGKEANSNDILLCAPTGKAAKRINEKTNFPASTIHRALGYNFDLKFMYDHQNQLPYDLIIIDEFSMVDTQLAWCLFRAIKQHANIVLVGDSFQLPSVGCGDVLNDMITSELIPTIFLIDIFRQKEGSGIVSLANSIRNGYIGEEFSDLYKDIIFYPANEYDTADIILRNINYLINNKKASLHEDIQVLIPIYKGRNGINNINQKISDTFNPNPRFVIETPEVTFKENDKVLQLRNDKELKLMNGDLGIIDKEVLVNKKNSVDLGYDLYFGDTLVKFKKSNFSNLQLAYAISVHKSQGSEFPYVIMPLLREYSIMLKRKLIYTAVTRAKKQLFIIGDIGLLNYCIKRIEDKRQTSLALRLKKPLKLIEDISPYDFMD